MNAAEIAAALGDARREGHEWRCRCPLHGGRSLILRDGPSGLLLHCFGGCDGALVWAELHRLDLLAADADGRHRQWRGGDERQHQRPDNATRTTRALSIWRAARPIFGSAAESYLAGRGITLSDLPANALAKLRYHPGCPHPTGARLPAMVALVEHVELGPVAIHRTFLKADGSGKLPIEPDKASLGPVGGAAVSFGLPRNGDWHLVGEGIETTATVAVVCKLPGWAALSAGGIRSLVLPPEARKVMICADHDENGVGQHAARDAAQRWLAEGRRVRIALPPVGADFNDLIIRRVVVEEARNVAA